MPDQSLCHFTGILMTERYWSLSSDERQQLSGLFSTALQTEFEQHTLYQIFPSRTEFDLLLWTSFHISAAEQIGAAFEQLARLLNAYRPYIQPVTTLWGLTRPSDYARTKSAQEIDPFSHQRQPYLVIYPFTKTSAWYQLSRDSRQGMMNEHIRTGHQYPQITQLLLYSTGLQDQEFVVCYETEDLSQFSSLVSELRTGDARPYTLSDTPIITAIFHTTSETLRLFA
jgi:chlorite dismutase